MSRIQGEGDDVSGRPYQPARRRYAAKRPVEQAGRVSAKGLTPKAEARRHDRKRDETLEQTYPASDPAPVTPGSN